MYNKKTTFGVQAGFTGIHRLRFFHSGRVGGERYNNQGGGSNYVCLTESPKYWNYTDVLEKYSAFMYGAEYHVNPNTPNPFNKQNLDDHDVPCAVCFVPNRNANLMIPATYECPAGWSKEYWGYLMAEYRTSTPTRGISFAWIKMQSL